MTILKSTPVREEVEFVIAFCNKNKEEVEISSEEACIILKNLNLYLSEIGRLSGSKQEYSLRLRATEKGSLELLSTVVEIGKIVSQLPLDLKPLLPLIAQNAGILGNGAGSIISFLIDVKGSKENLKKITTNNGGVQINGHNYGSIVLNIYNSPDARKPLSEIASALGTSENFDEIEFRSPVTKKKIISMKKQDAKYFHYDEESDFDLEEESVEDLKIMSSQFVGSSQWKFKISKNPSFSAKISDQEWLDNFQRGKFELNAKCMLRVKLIKKLKQMPNFSYKVVGFEVAKVIEILKPTKQLPI